MLNAVRNTVNR